MVTDRRVEVVNLKIWFAVAFFKRKGAELASPLVKFPEQNSDRRTNRFASNSQARHYDWAGLRE